MRLEPHGPVNAELDPLTGLLNRRAATHLLDRFTTDASANVPCSLILFDLDHLHYANQRFGHETIDVALNAVASLITARLPTASYAARFGGEEFLILLPGLSLAPAYAAAEAVRQAVQDFSFTPMDLRLTISAGVACSPTKPTWTAMDLLMLADMRLCVSKKRLVRSRNTVWAGRLPCEWAAQHDEFNDWPAFDIAPDY
ncbi:hypothetical protein GCM10025771_03520 [Niveibacterium umoris]|nr:GGDEF domain-containing protein [Niveibacterium umoris]